MSTSASPTNVAHPPPAEATDELLYEKADGIAVITLNRPERGNAVHPDLQPHLREVWADVHDDPDVRAAIITATGDRHFCTGADLVKASGRKSMAANRTRGEVVRWSSRQNDVWKPVIAVVNGAVAGAGLHFVVDADIVVAERQATFLDTHVNVGLVGGLENVGLSKRLPLGTALRMSLQGRDFRLTAERAFQLGLVDELVETGEGLAAGRLIARSIAKNSPQAVALTQQALWQSLEMSYSAALEHAWSLIRLHWAHPDTVEGPRAFVERREARWDPDPDARRT